MKRIITNTLLIIVVSLFAKSTVSAQGTATYEVTFTATWSASTHPYNFPSNPHFSGLIGATHNSNVVFWEPGQPATVGIKNMAEQGAKFELTNEVRNAQGLGTADELLDGGGLSTSPGTRKLTFVIRPEHPLVTLTSMIAPSPDWFVGVHRLTLLENNRWENSVTVDLFAYDAGTDSGTTYDSPNQATNPPENISRIETLPFLVDGNVKPLGTFTFELKSIDLDDAGYYRATGKEIVPPGDKSAIVKGMGLGGWLMPEGYMLHIDAPNGGGPTAIRNQMIDLIGEADTDQFFELYRANYVKEKDIAQIADWGFDHIRLPFHYRLFWDTDQERFDEDGFRLLDTFLQWCETHDLGVILDMHAAPGAQSDGGIADSDGEARLWTEPDKYWPLTIQIWREIARRYNTNKVIIGYDLINEPVTPDNVPTSDLRDLYVQIIEAVRPVDPNHIIFLEGNFFATTFGDLEPPPTDNMVYAFHKYWNGTAVNSIQYLLALRDRTDTPLWLGETGENTNPWFYLVTRLMEEHNIGVNWWTHKKIQTLTSPLSAPFSDGYQEVVDYWRSGGNPALKPNEDDAEEALFNMARNLDIDSSNVNRALLLALFDPNFGQLRIPFKEHKIPGIINAPDYDIGNQGVTYNDHEFMATEGGGSGGNQGYSYRNDGVDIGTTTDPDGFDFYVGWTNRLEWLTYTVQIEADGMYDVDMRVASAVGGGGFWLIIDDVKVGDDVDVASTGGWEEWVTLTMNNLELKGGTHILKILFTGPNVNISQLTFKLSSPTSLVAEKELPQKAEILSTYPNPFPNEVHVRFSIPEPSRVNANFYDILGRRIFETPEILYEAGEHTIMLNPELTPGVYMLRLTILDSEGVVTPITRSLVKH